jgi:hypothetical protein
MARRIRTQPWRGLRMRRLVRSYAVLIAALALGGCDGLIARFILPSEGIRPAEYAVAIERDVTMTTSDAVALVADIYRPKMNGAAPTILVRIPFSRTFRNSLSADAVGRFWASRVGDSNRAARSIRCVMSARMASRRCSGWRASRGSTAGSACGAAPRSAIPNGRWRIRAGQARPR